MSAEDHEMELVLPFVVVESRGGPYEDQAFTVGYAAGHIAARLEVAQLLGTDALTYPIVRRALLPQLDLIAMHFGFGHMDASEASDHIPASDEWCSVTFRRQRPDEVKP